jgi:hypothetical protein
MKKSLLFIGFFVFALLLLTNGKSYAQCTCTKANQDKTLINLYLGDITGTALTSTYTCTEGQNSKVYIWAVFAGNATRYSLFVHYFMYSNNVLVKPFDQCFFKNQAIPTATPVLIDTIQWMCGAEIKLDNYFMSWQANQGTNDCGCTSYHGCYAAPAPIIVKAPLIPMMTYNGQCSTGNKAQTMTFTDISTGGNYYHVGSKYSYLWNFGPGADYTINSGSLTTSPVVVTFNTSGNKTVALTVTDSTLVSKTVTETVTVNPCLHITVQASPGNFSCSNTAGITNWITTLGGAEVTGATGTVTWTYSPNPYTLTGGCSSYTGSARITFTATDAILSSVSTSATLTITDTEPPVITKPAADLTVECDGAGNTTAYNNWLTSHAGAIAFNG